MKRRLDQVLFLSGKTQSRSRAEDLIKRGTVRVNGNVITKPAFEVSASDKIVVSATAGKYVSRAGEKLASVARELGLDFTNKVVLDVGSSTGGFTDFALQNGASKVVAVDVGTDQLHPTLLGNPKIELHEKTDIREIWLQSSQIERGTKNEERRVVLSEVPDIVVIDVSFISMRKILPHISLIVNNKTLIITMLKPQFEAGKEQINRGVIKNSKVRREIIHDFEIWVQNLFKIVDKADSGLAGSKGNVERFYMLKSLR